MKEIKVSNKNAEILDKLVAEGAFKNPEAAVRDAIANYLNGLRQPAQAGSGVIDLHPAGNGAYNSQQQWIKLYNSQEGEFNGKRMIASYDIIGAPESASPETLASLQDDCRESWIVTSTHNSFQKNNLAGKVIHNYQSEIVRPKVISLDEIPVLEGVLAGKVVEMPSGLLYVRALADDRHAKPADLLNKLVKLARKEPENIFFYTPDQNSRNSYPKRAARFYDYGDWFRVGGVLFDDDGGLSRGVSVSPRSGRAKR